MTRGTIHHVYANRSNAGDWLSARGVQMLLGDVPIEEHLCDEPFVPETLRSLSTLQRTDIVVVGGGGLLMDYFVPFWEGLWTSTSGSVCGDRRCGSQTGAHASPTSTTQAYR